MENTIPDKLLDLETKLDAKLKQLSFPEPIKYVYHPLDYAFEPHSNFTNKYCTSTKKILFVAIHPGSLGMCQTGVPFGEINAVKDFLKITGKVSKPNNECSKVVIHGFDCKKSEGSGKRFWELFQKICKKDPENFFKNAFVYNHCPIGMLSDSGANYTPVRLEVTIREEVIKICDETLLEVIKLLQPNIIVGVGRRAESRCKRIVKQNKLSNDVKVIYLLHPSPLTRQSKNWVKKTEKSLKDLKLIRYFDGSKTEET